MEKLAPLHFSTGEKPVCQLDVSDPCPQHGGSATTPPLWWLLAATQRWPEQGMCQQPARPLRAPTVACPAQCRTEHRRLLKFIIPSLSPVVPTPELLRMVGKKSLKCQ